MRPIASNRRKTMIARQLGKDLPIVVFSWGPVPVSPRDSGVVGGLRDLADPLRDEIHSEPVLMRALPRSRFAGAFAEQVVLPVGTAQTLERFEQELRSVGLIGKGQRLRQSAKNPTHFRVQVGKKIGSSIDAHSSLRSLPSEEGTIAFRERAIKLRRSERKASPEAAPAEWQLPTRLTPRSLVRKKGGLPPT